MKNFWIIVVTLLIQFPVMAENEFDKTRSQYPWEGLFDMCILTGSFVEVNNEEKANYCYKLQQNALDRGLNRDYQVLLNELDPEFQAMLKHSQRAWINYRDSYFAFLESLCPEKQSVNEQCKRERSEITRLKAKFIEQQVLRFRSFMSGLLDELSNSDDGYFTENELLEWNIDEEEFEQHFREKSIVEPVHRFIRFDEGFLSEQMGLNTPDVRHSYFYEQKDVMDNEVNYLNSLIAEELYSDQLERFNDTKKAYARFRKALELYIEKFECRTQVCNVRLEQKLNRIIMDRIDLLEMTFLSEFYKAPQRLYYEARDERFNTLTLGDWDYE